MASAEPFVEAVRRELAFLTDAHGFQLRSATENVVEFESATLVAQAVWDPRGEVCLNVHRRGVKRYGQWQFVGMVGRASVARLLQLAGEQLRVEPWVLAADDEAFDQLAERQHREAEERTAYYSGKGPRPKRGHLP